MTDFINAWTWNLEDDSDGYQLLQPGVYRAKIRRFEQGEFAGSAKLSACPKAILTLAVETENGPREVVTSLGTQKAGVEAQSVFPVHRPQKDRGSHADGLVRSGGPAAEGTHHQPHLHKP